jgi:predicted nucleic acid-binding protein
MIRIVDASAVAAVLLVEPEADWVNAQTDGGELYASAVLPFEIGNIFWKRLRSPAADVEGLMAIWAAWTGSTPLRLMPSNPTSILRLARRTGLTFYDASYVQLALDLAGDLISLDRKLVQMAQKVGVFAPMPQATPRRQR